MTMTNDEAKEDPREMTTRQLFDYLVRQQEKGWPGSVSIKGRSLRK